MLNPDDKNKRDILPALKELTVSWENFLFKNAFKDSHLKKTLAEGKLCKHIAKL